MGVAIFIVLNLWKNKSEITWKYGFFYGTLSYESKYTK
jgi:hypothetical protein